jgi:hypothetical protein
MRWSWSWTVALVCALLASSSLLAKQTRSRSSRENATRREASASSGRPVGVWIGQDGHDLAGPSSVAEPSGVQDIHIVLKGLPTDREIEFASIQGLGGDEWQVNGGHGPWKAVLVREPRSPVADLYLEPSRLETGRPITLQMRFSGGAVVELDVSGGKADPNLRSREAALAVRWAGQDALDRVGLGPSVGPDGRQDLRLELIHLSPKVAIDSVAVEALGLTGWETGSNLRAKNNAELIRKNDDPSKADLFLQPDRDLSGVRLKVAVAYSNGSFDHALVTGGRCDPTLAVPRTELEPISRQKLLVRWIGQDGRKVIGDGDVHITLEGLPATTVMSAIMSNSAHGLWGWRGEGAPADDTLTYAFPMAFRPSADPSRAEILFPPDRDESGGTMTLRLRFRDGQTAFAQFPGGPADPALRIPDGNPKATVAKPGDDLNDLANRFGAIRLPRGIYRLSKPLVLNNTITVSGEKGSTLLFEQPSTEPPWSTAIKIHAGRTTLEGFGVRFEGPVRWNWAADAGPAVIGSTDNLDGGAHPVKAGIVLRNLDLESPSSPGPWDPAPNLIRLLTAINGRIEKNTLKGGSTELKNGPWSVVDNHYRGAVPNTATPAAFSVHDPQDLLLARNHVAPEGPSGKTWRFLILTGTGTNDVIRDNVVERIGPRDGDTIPDANASEVVLTESYRIHFEGRPLMVAPDGWILRIPPPQGPPAPTGSVVAILSGPHAGEWRRVAQAIDSQTYLMETPLPPGAAIVSLASGFVNETFARNRIDCRGSRVAVDMVLNGNHFGTRVIGNQFLGGGGGWMISACPTESPVHWGWSHAPFLGAIFERNTIEDAVQAGSILVEHGPRMKSNRGRTYMSMTLKDTVLRWTRAYPQNPDRPQDGAAITIGAKGSIDPAELALTESGTRLENPAGLRSRAFRLLAARVNHKNYPATSEPKP